MVSRSTARPQPMTEPEVSCRLERFPSWKRAGDSLTRSFEFASFMEGIAFVNRVAEASEQMDHHPGITVSWRTVTCHLTSHDAGGITSRDFALARRIDALFTGAH